MESWDSILVFLTRSKIDPVTRRARQDATAGIKEPVSWDRFSEFLDEKRVSLQSSAPSVLSLPTGSSNAKAGKNKGAVLYAHAAGGGSCALCKKSHPLWACRQFQDMPASERRARTRSLGYCFNCLGSGHRAAACVVTGRCKDCGEAHHTLLHIGERAETSPPREVATAPTHATHRQKLGRVWMATARVRHETADGRTEIIRALIDPCSEVNLISESVAQRLRAPRVHSALELSGMGGPIPRQVRSAARVRLRSLVHTSFSMLVEAYVLPNLTAYSPPQVELQDPARCLRRLKLADLLTATDGVEAVLGIPVYLEIMRPGFRQGPRGTFLAQNSRLG